MPYNLFLLPIVGGYFLLAYSVFFKYGTQRLSTQRLIFDSILVGLLFTVLVLILRIVLESLCCGIFNSLWTLVKSLPIKHQPYLGTTISVFTLQVLFTLLGNYLYKLGSEYGLWDVKSNLYRAIRRYGDELDRLFMESTDNENPHLIQVTLKTNKVYVGFIDDVIEPDRTKYLSLYPVLSGYRESENKQVHFLTNYDYVRRILIEESDYSGLSLMKIVIDQSEVISAKPFLPHVYDRFGEANEQAD